ncbi:hypothetical protein FTUN_1950 [Frigoriglobus tundricola]|uniref:Uncharacterized protein n=1 Tax=Frigoriglobus tundricola TaxID=2774151 RepID=A0A6M5YM53_9BACT|nr:hypothetical protein FTUN_1950 [Frigoriglobus tundricola]
MISVYFALISPHLHLFALTIWTIQNDRELTRSSRRVQLLRLTGLLLAART